MCTEIWPKRTCRPVVSWKSAQLSQVYSRALLLCQVFWNHLKMHRYRKLKLPIPVCSLTRCPLSSLAWGCELVCGESWNQSRGDSGVPAGPTWGQMSNEQERSSGPGEKHTWTFSTQNAHHEKANTDNQITMLLLCSVNKSCLTLCNLMDCSTPGFPVLHYLLEFAQTQVHWVSDAIQPSHPLSPPSPPALNLSQHQGVFQWVSSSHQVTKVLLVWEAVKRSWNSEHLPSWLAYTNTTKGSRICIVFFVFSYILHSLCSGI